MIPIVGRFHYSLVVVLHPGKFGQEGYRTCLIHTASLDFHSTSLFHQEIVQFMNHRYKREKGEAEGPYSTDTVEDICQPECSHPANFGWHRGV